jgi:20S proteasome subunit beta 7
MKRNDAFDPHGTYPIHARPKNDTFSEGVQRTQLVFIVHHNACAQFHEYRQPIVTGTSVLALKYKDGIMMAADTLGQSHSHF